MIKAVVIVLLCIAAVWIIGGFFILKITKNEPPEHRRESIRSFIAVYGMLTLIAVCNTGLVVYQMMTD